MSTVTMEEVQQRLPELLAGLTNGDEVIIVRDGQPVGRLLPLEISKGFPIIGRGKDKLISYIDDEEHLKDFAEYIE